MRVFCFTPVRAAADATLSYTPVLPNKVEQYFILAAAAAAARNRCRLGACVFVDLALTAPLRERH
jgi:hypothetical protein